MGFLNFMKKRGELPSDIDLDIPPEPPKIDFEEEISAEEPVDEELMPKSKARKEKPKAEEFPELPPLPEEEELPEMPPLPEIEEPEHMDIRGELPKLEELGIPEVKKEKKGLFSFFRKKPAEKPELPKELPELPELPEFPPSEEERIPITPEQIEPVRLAPERIAPVREVKAEKLPAVKPLKAKLTEKPKPRFIALNDFKNIQSTLNSSRASLTEVDMFFARAEELKHNEHKKYEELHSSLSDMHRKVMFIDKTLFEEV